MALEQAAALSVSAASSTTTNVYSSNPKSPIFLHLNPLPSSLLQFNTKSSKLKRVLRCSVAQNGHYSNQAVAAVAAPRPSEVPWKKELCNSVNLIGIVGKPVEIKHLSSGKAVASTSLAVKKSATDTTWINLTFWDELAHVASQHVEKGQQIYISGRLVSDTVENSDGKQQTYYKVVVQQLNFVERSVSTGSFDGQQTNYATTGKKVDINAPGGMSAEVLWQAFFANPVDWWDNRANKRSPKYPDFKHKDTGEALWIEGRYNPPWVKSQLAILDSRMESLRGNANMNSSFMPGDNYMPF